MSQDFETLPIGTEAALREMVAMVDHPKPSSYVAIDTSMTQARAILAQIDAQRKGATDAG